MYIDQIVPAGHPGGGRRQQDRREPRRYGEIIQLRRQGIILFFILTYTNEWKVLHNTLAQGKN